MSGKCRLFMFSKRFAGQVASGKKRTTIRVEENPRAAVGDIMRGINGSRKELRRAKIKGVHQLRLFRLIQDGEIVLLKGDGSHPYSSQVSEQRAEMSTIACKDGFDNLEDMADYFAGREAGTRDEKQFAGAPFDVSGFLYRW